MIRSLRWRSRAALAITIGVVLLIASSPAWAVPGPVGSPPVTRTDTDLVMSGT